MLEKNILRGSGGGEVVLFDLEGIAGLGRCLFLEVEFIGDFVVAWVIFADKAFLQCVGLFCRA